MEKENIKMNCGVCLSWCLLNISIFLFIGCNGKTDSSSAYLEYSTVKDSINHQDSTEYFEEEYLSNVVLLSCKYEIDSLIATSIARQYYLKFDSMSMWEASPKNDTISVVDLLSYHPSAQDLALFVLQSSENYNISKKYISSFIFDLRLAIKE